MTTCSYTVQYCLLLYCSESVLYCNYHFRGYFLLSKEWGLSHKSIYPQPMTFRQIRGLLGISPVQSSPSFTSPAISPGASNSASYTAPAQKPAQSLPTSAKRSKNMHLPHKQKNNCEVKCEEEPKHKSACPKIRFRAPAENPWDSLEGARPLMFSTLAHKEDLPKDLRAVRAASENFWSTRKKQTRHDALSPKSASSYFWRTAPLYSLPGVDCHKTALTMTQEEVRSFTKPPLFLWNRGGLVNG